MYLSDAAVTHYPLMANESCGHLKTITTIRGPTARECEDCVKSGGWWVHLRTCQTCGGTRCCDQSPNRHARKHAKSSTHSVVASAEPGERWMYCFEDDAYLEY
jgi:hypothetical protein